MESGRDKSEPDGTNGVISEWFNASSQCFAHVMVQDQ